MAPEVYSEPCQISKISFCKNIDKFSWSKTKIYVLCEAFQISHDFNKTQTPPQVFIMYFAQDELQKHEFQPT